MPSAEIFLAYHHTPSNKIKKFNPFPKPTVFSFVDPKGKLVITSPYDYEAAKHEFYRRALSECDFISVAEKICAAHPDKPPRDFHLVREAIITPLYQKKNYMIDSVALAWDIPLDNFLKHEKILDIAVRRKYGLRIAILLRIFLYCKLISRAKIYGTK